MEDKQGYFYIIPAALVEDGDHLKALLFGLITSLINKEGYCWASNQYLAEKLGRKDKSIISTKINALVKAGFLRLTFEDPIAQSGRRIYTAFAFTIAEKRHTPLEKTKGGIGKNPTPPLEISKVSNTNLVKKDSINTSAAKAAHTEFIKFFYEATQAFRNIKPIITGKDGKLLKAYFSDPTHNLQEAQNLALYFIGSWHYKHFSPSISTFLSAGIMTGLIDKKRNNADYWKDMQGLQTVLADHRRFNAKKKLAETNLPEGTEKPDAVDKHAKMMQAKAELVKNMAIGN